MFPFNSKPAPQGPVPPVYVDLMARLAKDLAAVPARMGARFLEVGDVSVGVQRSDGTEISGVVRQRGVVRTFTSYKRLLEYLRKQNEPAS